MCETNKGSRGTAGKKDHEKKTQDFLVGQKRVPNKKEQAKQTASIRCHSLYLSSCL